MVGDAQFQDSCREILEGLIACNSENPPGNERIVADFVHERLIGWGIPSEVYAVESHRPNLVATITGLGPGKRLILQSHLDTKPAYATDNERTAWLTDPFTATAKGDRVYGLGACDTKGGVCSQLAAFHWLFEHRDSWRGEVVWQGVADEENGSQFGAKVLLDLGLLKADAACVAEPTEMNVSISQLGYAWMKIDITGCPSHAGMPELGIDAVEVAFHLIGEINRQLAQVTQDNRFPGHPRLNVGRIQGGSHQGSVPGECEMWIDIRVFPGQRRKKYYDLVQAAVSKVELATNSSMLAEPILGGGCESNQIDPQNEWAQILNSQLSKLDRSSRCEGFPGGTDARFFSHAGTPAVVFGPGSLRQAHSPNEFVPFTEVVLAARVIATSAQKFLS